jgi:hypothetical protein
MSQSYRGDGYVSESVGSIPLYQTVIGAVTVGAAMNAILRPQMERDWPPSSNVTTFSPPPTSPSPSPTGSPK